MYKLLKPIHGGLGVLIQEVEGHIKQTGMEAVRSLKGDNVSQSGGPPPSLSLSLSAHPPKICRTCIQVHVRSLEVHYYTQKEYVLCMMCSEHVGSVKHVKSEKLKGF